MCNDMTEYQQWIAEQQRNAPTERCQNCRFWKEGNEGMAERSGSCRRHAPILAPEGPAHILRSRFPSTWEWDWCGDYRSDHKPAVCAADTWEEIEARACGRPGSLGADQPVGHFGEGGNV